MIRKAKATEIEKILTITKACAKVMILNNIFQWNAIYPSQKEFLNDIKRDELFVLVMNNDIVGCIVISTHIDEVYKPVKWLTTTAHNVYIHRLAVHPKHQGKGYAQMLMGFAEAFAKTQKFNSIRLDTFSQNKRNQHFYKQRGYQKLEAIYFPKQSNFPFYCYELVLN